MVCNQIERLCDALKHLTLPIIGYYFQSDDIANLIGLSLLSDMNWIVMDTDVDNVFYLFDEDKTYIGLPNLR